MSAKSSRAPFFRTTVACCGRVILTGVSSFKVRLMNGPGASIQIVNYQKTAAREK